MPLISLPRLPRLSCEIHVNEERSEFHRGLPSSIALCAQPKANLTGVAHFDGTGACPVAPADGTGVGSENRTGACPVAPVDGTGVEPPYLIRFDLYAYSLVYMYPKQFRTLVIELIIELKG